MYLNTYGLLLAAVGTTHVMDLGFVFGASREVSIRGTLLCVGCFYWLEIGLSFY